jgi:hypothetical protein
VQLDDLADVLEGQVERRLPKLRHSFRPCASSLVMVVSS